VRLGSAPNPADTDASPVVRVATGVAPERSFCLFNAVHELALPMIAGFFAFGHETPGQLQILAHVEAA
jgi:hypothetical protein